MALVSAVSAASPRFRRPSPTSLLAPHEHTPYLVLDFPEEVLEVDRAVSPEERQAVTLEVSPVVAAGRQQDVAAASYFAASVALKSLCPKSGAKDTRMKTPWPRVELRFCRRCAPNLPTCPRLLVSHRGTKVGRGAVPLQPCAWGVSGMCDSQCCSRRQRNGGKERGKSVLNRVYSRMRKHAAIALIAPLSCLTSAASASASAATVRHAQCTTENPRGDPPLLDQQPNQQQLRRTIEDSVLKGLATGMVAHHRKVERGELRRRPFVTLTYAQSIDGSIAGADKSQVRS